MTRGEARRAVFLDRDGTLIEDVHFLRVPDDVVLIPGAADSVRRANEAGRLAIVVTNQSGIARGLLTERDYESVRARIDSLMVQHGARIDAWYHCPHHPDFSGACDCRKPGVALFEQAEAEHAVDASHSVFIGDRWRDIVPARSLGGRGILVPSAVTPEDEVRRAKQEMEVALTLEEAVGRALDTLSFPRE
jgi:D-glycero-D-manno-heptose 1,7-bisphosphate phosphatase